MKEISNMKMVECPKCGEMGIVKKRGILAVIGLGGGLIASLTGSVITYTAVFSVLTLGFLGLSFFIGIGIVAFLLFFLPIYSLIKYYAGYTIECKECGAKYKISTKEFYEMKKEKDPIIKVVLTFIVCGVILGMIMS